MENIKTALNWILAGAVVVLLLLFSRSCSSNIELNGMNAAVADSLRVSTDELGRQTATISNLKTDRTEDFLKLETNDETIQKLQNLVKEYKGQLAVAITSSSNTTSSGNTVTTVFETDTIWIDSIAHVYPTYSTAWENKWEIGSIIAKRDSISRNIKVRNEFELTIGDASNGWFKKRVSIASIKNMNPNTTVEELRSFSIEHKPKRLGLGVSFGYGINLQTFKPSPYLGVGLNYTLWQIK